MQVIDFGLMSLGISLPLFDYSIILVLYIIIFILMNALYMLGSFSSWLSSHLGCFWLGDLWRSLDVVGNPLTFGCAPSTVACSHVPWIITLSRWMPVNALQGHLCLGMDVRWELFHLAKRINVSLQKVIYSIVCKERFAHNSMYKACLFPTIIR